MFAFKPKKVFEKINKMDRKQAYTVGAIIVVSIVALLMLISAMSSREDGSFDGMKSRGYDLATMPFATDEAEKFLLANAYPDMQENGSTLLYSAAEKEARQEADEDFQDTADEQMGADGDIVDMEDEYAPTDHGGYGGYGGYGGSGRGGRGGKTEIGQLSAAGMASAGGSGVNSTYGPSGDFRQFKGRENRGNEAPVQLKTGNARNSLAQFRSGSLAAARIQQNKMANAGKALYGGNVAGSEAFGKDGVDLSKLQNGGLTLDTSAPASTTDLDNLDKKVAEAAKKAEEKKKEEEKRSWWEDMLINLAQSAAQSLVDSVMGGVGDTIRGAINGGMAARKARNAEYRADSNQHYAKLTDDDVRIMTDGKYNNVADFKEVYSQKSYYDKWGRKYAKNDAEVAARADRAASEAKDIAIGRAVESNQQDKQNRSDERIARENLRAQEAQEAAAKLEADAKKENNNSTNNGGSK